MAPELTLVKVVLQGIASPYFNPDYAIGLRNES
jgi:hypothetical protein